MEAVWERQGQRDIEAPLSSAQHRLPNPHPHPLPQTPEPFHTCASFSCLLHVFVLQFHTVIRLSIHSGLENWHAIQLLPNKSWGMIHSNRLSDGSIVARLAPTAKIHFANSAWGSWHWSLSFAIFALEEKKKLQLFFSPRTWVPCWRPLSLTRIHFYHLKSVIVTLTARRVRKHDVICQDSSFHDKKPQQCSQSKSNWHTDVLTLSGVQYNNDDSILYKTSPSIVSVYKFPVSTRGGLSLPLTRPYGQHSLGLGKEKHGRTVEMWKSPLVWPDP